MCIMFFVLHLLKLNFNSHNLIKLNRGIIMKKIISFILGTIVALNLSMSVANAAAKEVRVAFFLEWPTPNQEDKVKGLYEKALRCSS